MGEEEKNQTPDIEQSQQEQPSQSTGNIESSSIKFLRQKLEEEIAQRKQLEEELRKRDELLNISGVDELLKKVETLELENLVAKKYPYLADEIEEIKKFRKPGESIEDTILRYIGKKTIEKTSSSEGFSLGSSKLSATPSESTNQEITRERAKEIFKQIYGVE